MTINWVNITHEEVRTYHVGTTKKALCTLCALNHKMKVTYAKCNSHWCNATTNDCPVDIRISECSAGVKKYEQSGVHLVQPDGPSPKKLYARLGPGVKAVIKQVMELDPISAPARIIEYAKTIFLDGGGNIDDWPNNDKLSNAVSKMKQGMYLLILGISVTVKQTVDAVHHLIANSGSVNAKGSHEGFIFCEPDEAGVYNFGLGSEDDHFHTLITTKAIMRKIGQARQTENLMFHIDTTMKTNTLGYNVIIGGVSDSVRSFHLMFISVCSHRTAGVICC